MQKKDWKHPRLGEFKAKESGSAWTRKMNVPEFAAFSYDTGYSNARKSTGDIGFVLAGFISDAKLDAPTPGMIAVAEKILNDPKGLVEKVVAALWEDFNGRGPESGIWWHGNMESINKSFNSAGLPLPSSAKDLLKVLKLSNIAVFEREWDYPEAIAFLEFHAAFEEEHGVTVLTNGDEILGDGFSGGDASPWKHLRKPKKPFKNPFQK